MTICLYAKTNNMINFHSWKPIVWYVWNEIWVVSKDDTILKRSIPVKSYSVIYNLVLLTGLIIEIGHHKEIRELPNLFTEANSHY